MLQKLELASSLVGNQLLLFKSAAFDEIAYQWNAGDPSGQIVLHNSTLFIGR